VIDHLEQRLQGKRMLVIGDLMIDRELTISYLRPSNEGGGSIYRHEAAALFPGGAANLAMNLASLGAQVDLIGPIGQDPEGLWLKGRLAEAGIDYIPMSPAQQRRWEASTVKTRILVQAETDRPLARIDRDMRYELPAREAQTLIAERGGYDALLLSDYRKGCFANPFTVRDLISTFRTFNPYAQIGVNAKPELVSVLPAGVDLVTLNSDEYREVAQPSESLDQVRHRLGARYLLNTRGAAGLWLIGPKGQVTSQGAYQVPVRDAVGCGDATFAAAMLALTVTDDGHTIAAIANAAGAAKVSKRGTLPVTMADLTTLLGHFEPSLATA
jgi:rfaE bifunctional protein kinase chain/domain